MKRGYSARFTLLGALILAPLAIAEAGTVHGTVVNGTTGKAAAGSRPDPAPGRDARSRPLQEWRAGGIHV